MKIKLLLLLFFVSVFSFAQVSLTQKDEFSISPNPGKTSLNIKLAAKNSETSVEVFDVLGKRVYKGQITQLESSVNISNWKSGVYLVSVTVEKSTMTKRFIKQ